MKVRQDIINLYVQEEWKSKYWKLFKQICKREGLSASEKVRGLVEEYVRDHAEGNPQTRLDGVLQKFGKPYRANKCIDCGREPAYVIFMGKLRAFACRVHFEKRKQKLSAYREIEKK